MLHLSRPAPLVSALRQAPVVQPPEPLAYGLITPAEQRVLSLLSRGESNRSIARVLVLSPRTVESHVSSLLAKTGCRNRTQLTLWHQTHP